MSWATRGTGSLASLVGILFLLPSVVRANEFAFSEASIVVVAPAFLLWLVVGAVLALTGRRVNWIGLGTFIAPVIVTMLTSGHLEIVFFVWMIYLTLIWAYYAFHPRNRNDPDRRANLIYHGSFLALIIIGGAIAKAVLWSHLGGLTEWIAHMKHYFPGFLILTSILVACCWTWVAVFMERRHAANTEPIKY